MSRGGTQECDVLVIGSRVCEVRVHHIKPAGLRPVLTAWESSLRPLVMPLGPVGAPGDRWPVNIG